MSDFGDLGVNQIQFSDKYVLKVDGDTLKIIKGTVESPGDTVCEIDEDGFVRGKVPAFAMLGCPNYTITTTQTKITLNAPIYDTTNGVTGNNRFTATVPGIYNIQFSAGGSPGTNHLVVPQLNKNGVWIEQAPVIYASTGSNSLAACAVDVVLAAGDYIELTVRADVASAPSLSNPQYTYLRGHYIGEAP